MDRFSKEAVEALDKLISKMNSRVGIDHIDYNKEKVVLSYVYNKGTADEWKERNFLDKEELARDLSARALGNIMKLARTIADMHDAANDLFPEEEKDNLIQARDMATALQLFGKLPVEL